MNLPYFLRNKSPFRYTIHRHDIFDVLTSVTEETRLLIIGVVSLGKQFSSIWDMQKKALLSRQLSSLLGKLEGFVNRLVPELFFKL